MKKSIYSLMFDLGFILFIAAFLMSFYSHGYGQPELPHTISMYLVIFFACVLTIFFDQRPGRSIKTNSLLLWFFALYVCWLLIEPYFSSWFDRSRLVTYILFYTPLSFFIASYLEPTKRQKKILLIAYLALGLFLFAWSILHLIVTHDRPDGPMLDANVFAGVLLCFVVPAIIYWLIATRETSIQKKIHEYLFIYILFGVFAFFSTSSRSAVLGLIVISLFLAIKLFRAYKTITLTRVLTLIVIVFLSFKGTGYFLNQVHSAERMSGDLELSTDFAYQSRIMMWKSGIDIYKDNNKFTGVGLGQFPEFYSRYRNPKEETSVGAHIHNDYLEFLIEGGLVQLGLIAILALFIIYNYWRLFLIKCDEKNSARQLKSFVALNLVCVFFIQANANFIFYVTTIAILIGLLLGYFSRNSLSNSVERKMTGRTGVLLSIVGMIIISMMYVHNYTSRFYNIYPHLNTEKINEQFNKQAKLLSIFAPRLLAINHYNLRYLITKMADKDSDSIGMNQYAEFNSELIQAKRNKRFDPALLNFYARFANKNSDLIDILAKKFPEQEMFALSPAELYMQSIDYDPVFLNSYLSLRFILIEKDKLNESYFIMRNRLYSSPEYLHLSTFHREKVLRTLLTDALELGYEQDAKNFAKEYLFQFPCYEPAHKVLNIEKPEECN